MIDKKKTSLRQLQLQKIWRSKHPDYMKNYAKNLRLEALRKISNKLECNRCGCNIIECLEINHKNGDGAQDRRQIQHIAHAIVKGTRTTKDLEILCRPCNAIDHLERQAGHILPMRVIFKRRLGV